MTQKEFRISEPPVSVPPPELENAGEHTEREKENAVKRRELRLKRRQEGH